MMVAFEKKPTGLTFDHIQISNFLPEVTKIYLPPGMNAPGGDMVLEIQVHHAAKTTSLQCPFHALGTLNFEEKIPGCIYALPQSRRLITQYLRTQLDGLLGHSEACGILFPCTGWYESGSVPVFVAGDQLICQQDAVPLSQSIVAEELAGIHLATAESSAATAAESLLRMLLRYERAGIPTFSYTLFGSLRSFWQKAGLSATCILYLVGTQGYGKTTLAKRLCTLYDNPEGQPIDVFDAQSTPAAMRDSLARARDRLVLLDDICKSSSSSTVRRRQLLAAELVRNAANETPICKMCGKISTQQMCAASLVVTGELPMVEPSDITRCITIEICKPLRNGSSEDRMIAATALAHYLRWFCRNETQELEYLCQSCQGFTTGDRRTGEYRLKGSLFQLSWVFGSFLRFAKEFNVLSQNSHQQLEAQADSIYKDIYSATERRLHTLKEQTNMPMKDLIQEAQRAGLPFQPRNGCLCIYPELLTVYLRQRLKKPELTVKDITSALRNENLLVMDKSGKATKKANGMRMLFIRTR